MNFQALLDHLPWVIDQLPEGSERRHAERLRSRTSTGSATLSLHESDRRFDVIDSHEPGVPAMRWRMGARLGRGWPLLKLKGQDRPSGGLSDSNAGALCSAS